MLRVVWQFDGNTYVSSRVHQALFGHKTTVQTKSGEKVKHFYDGLLGKYVNGEWMRKNGVEKVSNCCYLISEELIEEVKKILDKFHVRYSIDTELKDVSRRADWGRK